MSLLDTGFDTVTLYPAVYRPDSDGNPLWTRTRTPLVWSGVTVQWRARTEDATEAQRGSGLIRIIARTLPDGVEPEAVRYGRIHWGGFAWEPTDGPLHYGRTPAVRHVSVLCREVCRAEDDQ
ncbi:hypothetical protein [Sciscionella sediminilitoris]|uniref:hypothetical protein n=1 Tax=Sciscionella sediminilitoris TaxID=1445613 RepID=UPI0012E10752|nr:hypothetical protein [Sciscionella sp. SE31]